MYSILLIINVQIIIFVAYPCATFRNIHDPVVVLLRSLNLSVCCTNETTLEMMDDFNEIWY
jgi:hypothetical protein